MQDQSARAIRPVAQFAKMARDVAKAANVDVLICVTESGRLFQCLQELDCETPLIAATPSQQTYQKILQQGDADVIHLPVRVPDRFKEARHAVAMSLEAGKVQQGHLVQCIIGQGLFGGRGDFLVLTDVEEEASRVPLHDLVEMTNGIKPRVLDATLQLARRIGGAARRGKRLGTIFLLGDSENLLKTSRQLVLNPLEGHPEESRQITNPEIHDTLVELAKLDGAFVIRGDGLIQTAGTFLETGSAEVEPVPGLGTRHVSAATATAHSDSIAVVVSATDGNVRVFAGGELVMQLDAE